jgi:hypothetical protein
MFFINYGKLILREIVYMATKVEQLVEDLTIIRDNEKVMLEEIAKISSETSTTLDKVTELEALLADQDVPAEVTELVQDIKESQTTVKAALETVDELVPDTAVIG